jgi:hypothetical protein
MPNLRSKEGFANILALMDGIGVPHIYAPTAPRVPYLPLLTLFFAPSVR